LRRKYGIIAGFHARW